MEELTDDVASRRAMLKKAGAAGAVGATAWATPTVSGLVSLPGFGAGATTTTTTTTACVPETFSQAVSHASDADPLLGSDVSNCLGAYDTLITGCDDLTESVNVGPFAVNVTYSGGTASGGSVSISTESGPAGSCTISALDVTPANSCWSNDSSIDAGATSATIDVDKIFGGFGGVVPCDLTTSTALTVDLTISCTTECP